MADVLGTEVPDATALNVSVQYLRAERTTPCSNLCIKRGRWRVSGVKRGDRGGLAQRLVVARSYRKKAVGGSLAQETLGCLLG